MDPSNKMRLVLGLKMLALVIYCGLTIITCDGVWNFNPEGFVKWCALALGLCNAFLAVKYYLRLRAEYNEKVKALKAQANQQ